MCIIVQVPAGKSISKQQLQNCYDHNHDGWGIMFAKNNKLVTVKEVSSFDKFLATWNDVPRDAERAVHFRIKTAGEINKANCHPFMPTENIAMMHNGMIDTQLIQDKMSDTFNFVEYELKPVIAGWPSFMDDDAFRELMEEVTGGWSKLLFLDNTGKMLRVRPKAWIEREGLFYSNSNSFCVKYHYQGHGSSSYGYGAGYGENWGAGLRQTNSQKTEAGKSNDATPVKEVVTENATGTITSIQNREVYRPGNHYEALKSRATDALKQEMSEIKSDLYAGNKTDAEGQAMEASAEEERLQDLEAQLMVEDEGTVADDPDDAENLPEDEDLDQYPEELTMTSLVDMSDADLMDFIQDNPKSTLNALNGLMWTCWHRGIYEIEYDKVGLDLPKKKSAVS